MLIRAAGFLLSLILFLLIIYSIVTQSLFENLFFIGIFLLANVLIQLIAHFTKNSFFLELKTGSKKFAELLNKVIVSIALAIVYVFGVGFVWFVSKLAGKKFIDQDLNKTSNWVVKEKQEIDFTEMF